MSRVVIIHGWGGDSEGGWIPWLASELKQRGIDVIAPDMPNTNLPKIDEWVPFLAQTTNEVNEDTYFVGHSLGCQAILRYLQTLPEEKKVGGVVLVAGFVSALNLGNEERSEIANPWLTTSIDWPKVTVHTPNFVAIYSDNDPSVPVGEAKVLGEKLNAKVVLDSGRGHFSEGDDVTQLPSALNELLVIMGLPVETTLI